MEGQLSKIPFFPTDYFQICICTVDGNPWAVWLHRIKLCGNLVFTMSPPFPSPKHSPSPSTAPKKQPRRRRSPLHLLNVSETSSASTDAPTGCLRFFLSHSSSSSKTPANTLKTSSNSPNSTPSVRPIRSKLLKDNISKVSIKENHRHVKPSSPCLYRWHSGKRPSSTGSENSRVLSFAAASSDSADKHERSLVRKVDDKSQPAQLNSYSSDLDFTPLCKMEVGSESDLTVDKVGEQNSNSGNSKTPPVQASISPEIQCASSFMSKATPVCYGAGYVVSGVSDKRKCRPRGVLIVGENNLCISNVKAIDNFDSEEGDETIVRDNTDSIISKLPSPIEASMNWLLSPCHEEDENQKEDSENSLHPSQSLTGPIARFSLHSLLSVDALALDIDSGSDTKLVNKHRRDSALFISPSKMPEFQGLMKPLPIHPSPTCTPPNCLDVNLKEGKKQRYQLNGENSPFSMDSLGSENVVRTPQSDSSLAQKVCAPWSTAESCEKHDLNSVSELLLRTNPSPGSSTTIMKSTDLSFEFDCLATISNSMDLNQFQKILDGQASWNSYSSSEDVVKSQMRVSWREGLTSRMYEIDEFDSCRCLSDEEEVVDSCSNDLSDILQAPLEQNECGVHPIVSDDSGSPELARKKPEAFEKCREMLCCQKPCSCAESISTDGGGLVASGDSDWNLCYKNRLFDF